MPNPSELFSEGLHHSSARIELGDLRFNSEVGHKITLNYIFQNKNINLSVNPYINSINDFILIEPTSVQTTIIGNFQVWEYRQTNAQILGLDIDALKIVAEGINSFKTKDKSFILITHYHRIIKYLSPDYVHVMLNGKIAKSGGEELAIELEERGYDWINNQ